jgi:hypothetical protein
MAMHAVRVLRAAALQITARFAVLMEQLVASRDECLKDLARASGAVAVRSPLVFRLCLSSDVLYHCLSPLVYTFLSAQYPR